MTDRRRNLFVLLLVAALLLASVAVIATKPTRLGLDLKGGVSLIYQAKPTKQSAVTGDAIDELCLGQCSQSSFSFVLGQASI